MRLAQLAAIALFTTLGASQNLTFDAWEHGRVALETVSIHFRYAGTGPPLLLVHGNPQHSLTWQWIGPRLVAAGYTVIAPDNRGAGDSSIPPDADYSAAAHAGDLVGVLNFLNVSSAYVFAHDKGVGFATALAATEPSRVKMLGLAEYALPGFGYDEAVNPGPFWDLYQNPQLAFFQIPDFAEFLMAGRERAFLQWYFYHGSYSGTAAFSELTVDRYASSVSKPGFLRAMLGPFSTAALNADRAFFTKRFAGNSSAPLEMPVLAMGGEASFGLPGALESLFNDKIAKDIEFDVVPKAGHWIADENPNWVADRILKFLGRDNDALPAVDLSHLKDQVTLSVGYFGTLRNARLGGMPV
ncbi:putative hydrolase or acyltransferase of alpha beta superfamily protein [Favolaschia claudopus]|uniref:Hydrolase or acyltransferase of alpha beta superfamily protein n=1 Tax=Favolaschia claudopus TaxID=2862362 RepID=A0AAW0C8G6_9AGAR